MTLTLGSAPFGPKPAGTFNFVREGPTSVLYWEDFPKRFRVIVAGVAIADSRRAKALHETGKMMRVCFPGEDVRIDLMERTGSSEESASTGTTQLWSMRLEGKTLRNFAWSYDAPPASAPPIRGYMSFDLETVDAWYQEDDKGYAHPKDPYHGIDIHNASRSVIVRSGDIEIARSNRPKILFETGLPPRYYLPPEDVREELIEKSVVVSQCPYKGDGQHWHVGSGTDRVENAAWSLPEPLGEAEQLLDWLCFYPDKLTVIVDGKALSDG